MATISSLGRAVEASPAWQVKRELLIEVKGLGKVPANLRVIAGLGDDGNMRH